MISTWELDKDNYMASYCYSDMRFTGAICQKKPESMNTLCMQIQARYTSPRPNHEVFTLRSRLEA